MKLANLLLERRITVDLKARTKDEAVRELLTMISNEGVQINFDAILASVREREEIEDTCYGHGFAFPHARTNAVSEMYILIGVSKRGLEDRTRDATPVHVVCLLLTPSTIAKLYLQMLSGLAAFGRRPGTLAQLLSASSPAEVIKMVADANVMVDKELMVRDIMRHRVATVTPENTLKDVANQMFRFRLSAVGVIDQDGKMLGVITDLDLIRAALPNYEELITKSEFSYNAEPFEELLKREDSIKVSQLYRTDFEVTSPETRIVEVAAMMIFKDVRRVFVTSEERLLGVLLRKDIVNMIIRG